MKKIAIVGGGMTGLSCGVALVDAGYEVTIFEASEKCGGLASGFKGSGRDSWKWSLEIFYHHIFTGDKEIQDLARKVGADFFFKEPLTTSFFHLKETQLDSPLSLLRFSGISLGARLRMGIGLGALKLIPRGTFLEKYKVTNFLPKLIGKEGYRAIWEKLLTAKFGPFKEEVNMAWFWTRVAKRSKKLGYFEGGFQGLVDRTVEYIEKRGGGVVLEKKIESIEWIPDQVGNDRRKSELEEEGGVWVNGEGFDAVVMTTPAPTTRKLLGTIVGETQINYLWGQTLILETSKKLIKGYWMNILEDHWPFLVMVDHTNFIDKKYYGGKRIVYLGNYLPEGHPQLKMNKEQLLKLYTPFIKKISKGFNKTMIKNMYLFREPFAQPVFPVNYSKSIPSMRSPVKGVYLANMSMVYPFDRGTNYAVKMGVEVAKMVMKDLKNR